MVSGSATQRTGGASASGWTLALDASTYAGTVAVLRDGDVVVTREAMMRGEQEERLMPAVLAALAEAGIAPRDLARVVCGAGPGSFTSLRIAAGIAKGIAHGAGLPLYAVSSPALAVAGAEPALSAGEYLAVLDALRGERYTQRVRVGADGIVTADTATNLLRPEQLQATVVPLVGPLEALTYAPHARGVARLLGQVLEAGPVELEGWEPSYGRLAEAQVRWEAAHGRALGNA